MLETVVTVFALVLAAVIVASGVHRDIVEARNHKRNQ